MSRRPLPNIWRSYGAQLCIIDYYSHSKVKVLQLQLINRESYNRTIARCQYTLYLPEMIAFTFPLGKLVKSIMLLDGVTGEVRMIEDDRFDFTLTRTVVVLNELYAFKAGSPVSAYKIADFTSSENLVKTTLPTLPRHEYLF